MESDRQQQGRVNPSSNCLGECVEQLLGRNDVPNFAREEWRSIDRGNAKSMIDHLSEWAHGEGYNVEIKSGSLAATSTTAMILLAATGPSGKGSGHAVVAKEGKIVHDPLGDPEYSATFPFDSQIEITRP